MQKRNLWPNLFLALGITLIALTSLHRLVRHQSLALSAQIVSEYASLSRDKALSIPTHLKIGWYVNQSVTPQVFINNNWVIAENSVSYLLDSARPTESGNIILYGHNYPHVLSNLRLVPVGQSIELTLADGRVLNYQVTHTAQVSPNNPTYLMPTDIETLTIYTCAGVFDSERFIVQASRVDAP